MKAFVVIGALVGALALGPIPAPAAVTLATSQPAEGTAAAGVTRIALQLSAPIDPASLAIALTMTGMPGMSHHAPMRIAGFRTDVAADRAGATVSLPRALPAGSYALSWKATGMDGTQAEGTLHFSAR